MDAMRKKKAKTSEEWGAIGGKTRAQNLTREQLVEQARHAANVRWGNNGSKRKPKKVVQ